MNDDIVTRLREMIPLPLQFADESAPAHLISEAADEIERLRKENEILRAQLLILIETSGGDNDYE